MTEITKNADCGNAPKELFPRDLNIAPAHADADDIRALTGDDFAWKMVWDVVLFSSAAGKEID